MQFFAILLSSILGILSPAGLVVDKVAENAIRHQFSSIEKLAVRIDNAPSYRFLQGKADRVRIAGRGLYPIEGVRIAALELETDPIALSPASIRTGKLQLAQPLRAGVRLVLTRQDINRALQSPAIANRFRDLSLNLLANGASQQLQRYTLVDPQVEFLGNNRIRLQVMLAGQQSGNSQPDRQAIVIESGIAIAQGHQIQLVDPQISLDGQPVPSQLVSLLIGGLSDRLDLDQLTDRGITARILKLEVMPDGVAIAGFVSLDPAATSGIHPNGGVVP
jgi:LmeA-like phospholipid-binding